MRGLELEIDAHNLRAVFHEAMGGFLADAGARADHEDYLPCEFLLGGHALQFSFFEQPVFDIESLLLWQGDVSIDRFGPAHHFDRAVIKFGSHPRL